MTMNVFEKIEHLKARSKERYRALVIAAADGEEMDGEELLAVVRDAKKTLDDFQRAVSTLQARKNAVAQLEEAAQMRPAIAEATKKHSAHLAGILELKKRHKEELEAAEAARAVAYSSMSGLESQKSYLEREANEVLVGTRSANLDGELSRMESEIQTLRNSINSRAVAPLPQRTGPGGVTHPADVERLERIYQEALADRAAANRRDQDKIAALESAIKMARQRNLEALSFDII